MKQPKQEAIRQITEFDSRFYVCGEEFRPSVTYILGTGYPTPAHLQKWKADLGWDEAESVKNKAADEGSIIHNAIEQLLQGKEVVTVDLSLKAKRSIQAFIDWYSLEKPQILKFEYKVWAGEYAGTVDLLCRIASDNYQGVWVIDYKSGGVYETGKAQIMAYKAAEPDATRCAILQLGNTTKKRYTFSEVKPEDEQHYWNLFNQCLSMYHLLKPNDRPPEAYPFSFSLPELNIINPKQYARNNVRQQQKALPKDNRRKNNAAGKAKRAKRNPPRIRITKRRQGIKVGNPVS